MKNLESLKNDRDEKLAAFFLARAGVPLHNEFGAALDGPEQTAARKAQALYEAAATAYNRAINA